MSQKMSFRLTILLSLISYATIAVIVVYPFNMDKSYCISFIAAMILMSVFAAFNICLNYWYVANRAADEYNVL